MNKNSIYTSIINAKNGTAIPVFSNGQTVDSRYNPEREADSIISQIKNYYRFFIIIGIGSGILIKKINLKFPKSKIIAIDKNKDDLYFLSSLPVIKELMENKNNIFTDITNLFNVLINNYLPAMYGNIKIIEQKGWINNNINSTKQIQLIINKSLDVISADYSVQCHFGKIWQSNIIKNLKMLSTTDNIKYPNIDIRKKALIVAAGPSLDDKISMIKQNDYFIISTDTALGPLIKNNIIPNIVVSIDGQHISHNHFMNDVRLNDTIFALDLCSDNSTGIFLNKLGYNTFYFITGHPLSLIANKFFEQKLLKLFSGSGTVTITAVDLALKLGFTSIDIVGADFCYSKGKAYTKGTYFENIFENSNNRIISQEMKYDNLMYRTELKLNNYNEQTTQTLESYKTSLEQYFKNNNIKYILKDKLYSLKVNTKIAPYILKTSKFNYRIFLSILKESSTTDLTYPLLPYISWLKNQKKYINYDFKSLLKLAQSHIVSYN